MISAVVAFDKNQLIGVDNKLPWHYKEDLKYFKKVTTGGTILMGWNTFESIIDYAKKPLPDRTHIVVTRNIADRLDKMSYENVFPISDIEEYIINKKSSGDKGELFIIGGASVFEQTLDLTDKMYVTHINKEFEGDTYFPDINWDEWELVSEKESEESPELRFCVYERKL